MIGDEYVLEIAGWNVDISEFIILMFKEQNSQWIAANRAQGNLLRLRRCIVYNMERMQPFMMYTHGDGYQFVNLPVSTLNNGCTFVIRQYQMGTKCSGYIRRTHDQLEYTDRHGLTSHFEMRHHLQMDSSTLCSTTRTTTNHIHKGIGNTIDNVRNINENIDDCENCYI